MKKYLALVINIITIRDIWKSNTKWLSLIREFKSFVKVTSKSLAQESIGGQMMVGLKPEASVLLTKLPPPYVYVCIRYPLFQRNAP